MRNPPGEQLVQDDPDRVHVAGRAGLSVGLFGRHVVGSACGDGHRLRAAQVARQTQIGKDHPLGATVFTSVFGHVAEQHVGRLDVAMHDAQAMRDGHCVGEVEGERGRLGDAVLAAGRETRFHAIAERSAAGVLHHEVRATVGQLVDRQDADESIRVEPSKQASLLDEPSANVGFARQVVGEHLDRDGKIQRLVVAQPDLGVGATAEQPVDAVAANPVHHVRGSRRARRRPAANAPAMASPARAATSANQMPDS